MAKARPGSLSRTAWSIPRQEPEVPQRHLNLNGNRHARPSIVRGRDHPHDAGGLGAGIGAAVRYRALEGETVAGLQVETPLADPEVEHAGDHQPGLDAVVAIEVAVGARRDRAEQQLEGPI